MMQFFNSLVFLLGDLARLSMVWKCFIIIISFIVLIPCVRLFNRGR